jgi:hypothetical protein
MDSHRRSDTTTSQRKGAARLIPGFALAVVVLAAAVTAAAAPLHRAGSTRLTGSSGPAAVSRRPLSGHTYWS